MLTADDAAALDAAVADRAFCAASGCAAADPSVRQRLTPTPAGWSGTPVPAVATTCSVSGTWSPSMQQAAPLRRYRLRMPWR